PLRRRLPNPHTVGVPAVLLARPRPALVDHGRHGVPAPAVCGLLVPPPLGSEEADAAGAVPAVRVRFAGIAGAVQRVRGGNQYDGGGGVMRLFRFLFTSASVLSLVLCAAAVVLWVRSGQGGDAWSV